MFQTFFLYRKKFSSEFAIFFNTVNNSIGDQLNFSVIIILILKINNTIKR